MSVGSIPRLRIRELREKRHWTQTELAFRAGVSISGISLIESGHRNPTLIVLTKVSRALGVKVADLLDE